jgi:DHA1 family bicyclomycin/chloramphenicol resistance-like MFS transporter
MGMVSSCQAFEQSMGNAAAAAALVPLLWDSPLHMAIGMAALLATGALLYRRHLAVAGRAPRE